MVVVWSTGILNLMQAWSVALGIYSYWHPMAIFDILPRSQLLGSLPSLMYPLHPNFNPCSVLLIFFQPFCVHMGEGANKGRCCPTDFWSWENPRALSGPFCLLHPGALSRLLFLVYGTEVGKLCPVKGQIGNMLGKSSTLPLQHEQPKTICGQMDMAQFQCNFIYKTRQHAKFCPWVVVCWLHIFFCGVPPNSRQLSESKVHILSCPGAT